MVRCCVVGCKSDSERKRADLSFHSFPSNNDSRKVWIEATGRRNWEPKTSSRICSDHFEENMLVKKNKLTVLIPNATPQLVCKNLQTRPTSSQFEELMEIDNLPQCSTNMTTGTLFATKSDDILSTNNPQTNQAEMVISSSPSYTPRTMKRKLDRTTRQSKDRLKKILKDKTMKLYI